jgi:N-acetylmuramoyl-L-alanine amidase
MCLANFFKFFGKKDENEQTEEINDTNIETVIQEESEIDDNVDDVEIIEEQDEQENLGSAQTNAKRMKILVDNGHGYNTPGKRSPYSSHGVEPEIPFFEYKWNREIAKPIVEQLVAKGYDAELLVPEDYDTSLRERAKRVNAICNKMGISNVMLISIHANAAGNGKEWKTAKGWCAFTSKGTTKSDTIAEYLYTEAEKNFKGRQIRKDMSDGDRDWEANFTVLAETKCPAVLTENFFYDNPDDTRYILSQEGRDAVIKTHVDGIINYINSL